jgi:23S rRNA pseudouridine1911/1915/1917 synthase
VHPITGEAMRFEAPLPADMAAAWSELEGEAAKVGSGV